MDQRRLDLYLRHIREGGAKISEFLVMHPHVDPYAIDDLPLDQQAALDEQRADLAVTQQIELGEINADFHVDPLDKVPAQWRIRST